MFKLFIEPQEMYCTEDGLRLCRLLYEKLKPFGLFVALTGGTLYKEGKRKDIDLVLYRHRQTNDPLVTADYKVALEEVGFTEIQLFGFVTKCKFNGIPVDIFNPEDTSEKGDY